MALKFVPRKERFRSTVADVIDFKPLENPPWRTKTSNCPSTEEMIKEIADSKQEWDSKMQALDDALVDEVKRKLEAKFFHHCNVDEDHGLKNPIELEKFLDTAMNSIEIENQHLSLEEQETLNLRKAYLYLQNQGVEAETTECRGLLEESMLREVNKIILRNIQLPKSSTKPGTYSNRPRVTEFDGEIYYYQQPDDMMAAVCTLLDRFNSLFTQSMKESTMEVKLEGIFKSVAWLVFELLDIHPFSDGNGRLCRLLCCYVLSTICPFPSPIYNMYSESSMKDFERTLVDTRRSSDRKPLGLATMIIESNWATWKKLSEIEKEIKRTLSQSDLQESHLQKDLPRNQTCSKSVLVRGKNNGFIEHKVHA